MLKGFILVFLVGSAFAECPSKEVMKPCTCNDEYLSISCSQATSEELAAMFKRVSANVMVKHFNNFYVNVINSNEIPANITQDLTFQSIQIGFFDNTRLKKIHSQAFAGSAKHLNRLEILNQKNITNSPAPYNIFDLINSFTNIQRVNLEGLGITDIPTNAFKNLKLLNNLYISGLKKTSETKRMTIGDDSFYQLTNIRSLYFSNNRINKISANAFRLRNDSTFPSISLNVVLSINNLNSTSFERGSLEQFNKPTTISLFNNQIQYLDKNVFRPFLKANNRNSINNLGANPLNCSDCRNAWLQKEFIMSRVNSAFCGGDSDGKTLFNAEFSHCKNQTLF